MASPTALGSWHQEFGDLPPAGHFLRDAYADRWVRIHSLPKGKRYASDEEETRTLIRRHNEVADAVLGEGSECLLFVPYFDSPSAYDQDTWARPFDFSVVPAESFRKSDDPDETPHFLVSKTTWAAFRFNRLIATVAADVAPSVTFFSLLRRSIYAPYDGGADIIAPSAAEAAQLRTRWRRWMSSLPSGL